MTCSWQKEQMLGVYTRNTEKKKKLPVLKNKFEFPYFFKLHAVLMLLYRTQKKFHCNCYVKDTQEIPCQLCILCSNTASDKVAGKVTSGTIAVTLIARHPYNGWKQLNKKLSAKKPFKEFKKQTNRSSQSTLGYIYHILQGTATGYWKGKCRKGLQGCYDCC